MYNPRIDIVKWLTDDGINISKQSQNVFNELPAVTYYISSHETSVTLDKEIAEEDVTAQIDIWTESGPEGSALLDRIDSLLRQHNYYLEFASDVPNPDTQVQHISARFRALF